MVMKPEPWGEALDARARPTAATLVVPTPAGEPFTQAVARELADPRPPGLRLRALRGHRPAGGRPRGRRGAEVREVSPRRLRAQRRRGGRAGDHRGRRPAAARVHGQRRVAGRGVARGRAAGVPRLHQARVLARPRRPAVLLSRRPRARSPAGATSRRCRRTAAASAGPAARRSSLPRTWRGRARACPPTPGSCSPCSGPAGCRRQQANPGVRSRRCTSPWTTCAPGSASGRCSSRASRGRLVGARARARRDGDAWDVGRLMVAPDLQGAAWAAACWRQSRRRRPPRRRRTRCSPARAARATSGCTRRPATGCAASSSPGVVLAGEADGAISAPPRLCGRLAPRPSRPKDRPEDSSGGSASGTCHRGSSTPPATTTGPHTTEHTSDPRLTCGTREERP